MSTDIAKLLKYLEVEQIDKYLFIGKSPKRPARIFGGQVLAQSLNAAIRTVDDQRTPHSMHAYFLRPGNPAKQIVYEVDPIRDGKSFTTRSIVAKQDGAAIFNTSVSFQIIEEGLSHQIEMPDVPPPEEVASEATALREIAKKYPDKFSFHLDGPIERKRINPRDYLNPLPQDPVQHFWIRVSGDLGDDLSRHQTLLAYVSDMGLLATSLYPHPMGTGDGKIQAASLDHALWFHRPFRVDEYLLYTMDSPNAFGSRGFSRGSFYSRDGVLVASTTQESLIRRRED